MGECGVQWRVPRNFFFLAILAICNAACSSSSDTSVLKTDYPFFNEIPTEPADPALIGEWNLVYFVNQSSCTNLIQPAASFGQVLELDAQDEGCAAILDGHKDEAKVITITGRSMKVNTQTLCRWGKKQVAVVLEQSWLDLEDECFSEVIQAETHQLDETDQLSGEFTVDIRIFRQCPDATPSTILDCTYSGQASGQLDELVVIDPALQPQVPPPWRSFAPSDIN
jgi:hypothetical protein